MDSVEGNPFRPGPVQSVYISMLVQASQLWLNRHIGQTAQVSSYAYSSVTILRMSPDVPILAACQVGPNVIPDAA